MKCCDVCGDFTYLCDHRSSRSDWSWEPVNSDTNIGIRAKGLMKTEKNDGGSRDRLRDKGKSVGADFGDERVNTGKCGQGCNKGKFVTQGKPSTRSWKSPIKNFPKKMVPKGFAKKFSHKGSAPIGRPGNAGIRCFMCKQFWHIASICPTKYINLTPLPVENDYLVDGTCGGSWDSICVVDPSFMTHITRNRSVIKRFKRQFGVTTDDKKKEFSFVHGVGEVKIPVDGKNMSEKELEEYYLEKFYEGLDVDNGHDKDKEKLKTYVEGHYEREFEIDREKNRRLNDEGTSGIKRKEIVYSKKAKVGFMIYYEGLKDNPSQPRQELRQGR
ncbi:putative transcription factor interactor and regulator CCHC(Zn) family [Helianthus anomalus]